MPKVKGMASLERRMAAIPKALRANVRYAMEDQADKVTEDMWQLAPYRSGVLSSSIGWTWGDAPAGSMSIGKVGKKEYGTMRITIHAGGGDAFYARFHEFGTKDMPAHPFFYPVWRARRKRVKSAIARAINKTIKEMK